MSILTLFFNQNAGGDQTQIFYLGFKGEFAKVSPNFEAMPPAYLAWTDALPALKRAGRPGQIVYEAQANPADHVKLPGMGVGMHSSLGS